MQLQQLLKCIKLAFTVISSNLSKIKSPSSKKIDKFISVKSTCQLLHQFDKNNQIFTEDVTPLVAIQKLASLTNIICLEWLLDDTVEIDVYIDDILVESKEGYSLRIRIKCGDLTKVLNEFEEEIFKKCKLHMNGEQRGSLNELFKQLSSVEVPPYPLEDGILNRMKRIGTSVRRQFTSLDDFLQDLQKNEFYCNQIQYTHKVEAVEGEFEELKRTNLNEALIAALLEYFKVEKLRLYSHQSKGIDALSEGKSLSICTSTSSGKSLIYTIAVLNAILTHPHTCAIYIFPTKVLAQNQLKSLQELLRCLPSNISQIVKPFLYDGDTPFSNRMDITKNVNILMTNPDMLHYTIIPNHKQFEHLLKNLKFIVLDEAHIYKGIFGIHCSFVIKRLIRICIKLYHSIPQVICCSATMADPRHHFEKFVGYSKDLISSIECNYNMKECTSHVVEVITEDGSPCGKKMYILWNPPLLDDMVMDVKYKNLKDSAERVTTTEESSNVNEDPEFLFMNGKRRSPIFEAAVLMAKLVCGGYRTIAFCRWRKVVEVLLLRLHEVLKEMKCPDVIKRVTSYRGGYAAVERRQIEKKLFEGELLGVVSTNALELGIDVGYLDVAIVLGFPGTISSMYQQFGRCGRGVKESASYLIALNSPVDQHLVQNGSHLFKRTPEASPLDLSNPLIIEKHISCAANELTHLDNSVDFILFSSNEDVVMQQMNSIATEMCKRRELISTSKSMKEEKWKYNTKMNDPHKMILLRSSDNKTVKVFEKIDEITKKRKLVYGGEELSVGNGVQYDSTISAAVTEWVGSSQECLQYEMGGFLRSEEEELMGGMKVIDEIDYVVSFFTVHPQAIYLNRGKEYIIDEFDPDRRYAIARLTKVNYFTRSRDHKDVDVQYIVKSDVTCNQLFVTPNYGRIQVNFMVWGYLKFSKLSGQLFEKMEGLALPPIAISTLGFWFDISLEMKEFLEDMKIEYTAAIHATQHAVMHALPMHVPCELKDIATDCPSMHNVRYRPHRFSIFDSHPGGNGVTGAAFKHLQPITLSALQLLESCGCATGCSLCIYYSNCGEYNEMLCKEGALWVLRGIAESYKTLAG